MMILLRDVSKDNIQKTFGEEMGGVRGTQTPLQKNRGDAFGRDNPYLELLTPPVIKVPGFSWKFLWFFLYKNLQLVYPPYGREVFMRIPRRN